MSSLAQALEITEESQSVTTISANARVDYILRFSKHAVMVVDEQISLCSSVGSQYLSNLPHDQNAAYITMSAKLNDLQVRCRVIEQLFGNILFDPEQSIAVSVINLVKKHQQAVSIVIDNAHLLSLQITHELCQLAEIARKSDNQINVLMLATPEIGVKVSQNLSLFHKKLSIISAKNGQLISHQSTLFTSSLNLFSLTPFKKWSIFFLLLALCSLAGIFYLLKQDTFNFSQRFFGEEINKPLAVETIIQSKETFVNEGKLANVELQEKATSLDIFNALSNNQNEKVNATKEIETKSLMNDKPLESLNRDEILVKIAETRKRLDEASNKIASFQKVPIITDKTVEKATEKVVKQVNTEVPEKPLALVNNKADKLSGIDYYLEKNTGFVIQIAGFTQLHMLKDFMIEYEGLDFYQYKRFVNNEAMTMLTSAHYLTREEAQAALSALPQAIKDRSPWIKSISAINNEINSFQRSQSKENNVTIPQT